MSLLAAVVAAMPILGFISPAHAQYRVGEDGHANDANNRIGSGGYNSGRDASMRPYGATGNQIVTGNSTGLSYFHGGISYTDPAEFRQSTGSIASDRFLAISSPINYAQRTGSQYQPFYSTGQLVAPPPGSNFVKTPGGGGLLPAPPLQNSPNDRRLGIVTNAQNDTTLLPTPGELVMPGPVDSSGNASALTASPLYGLRQWSPNDPGDAYFLSRYTNVRPEGAGAGTKLDNAAIMRMRQELNGTIVQPNAQPQALQQQPLQQTQQQPLDSNVVGPSAPAAAKSTGVTGGALTPAPQGSQGPQGQAPAGSPMNPSLSGQALSSAVSNPALIASGSSNQGVVQRLLIPPEEQSTQIADLERRYARVKGDLTGAQANQLYNREVALRDNPPEEPLTADGQPRRSAAANAQANAQANTPANAQAGANGQTLAGPDYAKANQEILNRSTSNPMVKGPLTEDRPYVITSLATGVKAKGLADLLTSAEDQMRRGKFTDALDTYDSAQRVAPNNPFIALGRSFAELGASYYGRAEGDLRRAVTAEPAVLAGRYDLKGFLGEDRLKFVVKDLRDIAAAEKAQRPVFLLAYIFHNVGDDDGAARQLDDAEKRGGQDPVLNLMRTAWDLQKPAPAGN